MLVHLSCESKRGGQSPARTCSVVGRGTRIKCTIFVADKKAAPSQSLKICLPTIPGKTAGGYNCRAYVYRPRCSCSGCHRLTLEKQKESDLKIPSMFLEARTTGEARSRVINDPNRRRPGGVKLMSRSTKGILKFSRGPTKLTCQRQMASICRHS